MQRYVAYASDVHEPLRPLAHPYLIPAAYAISWGYVVGDAVHEAHKASRFNTEASKSWRLRQPEQGPHRASYKSPAAHDVSTTKARTFPILEDHRIVAMQRILFHSMASMALPAFTVRYIVKYTNSATKGLKSQLLRTSGPIGLSLSAISVFPYVFDKPVEDAVEWIFYQMLKKFGGQEAVGDALKIGRRNQLRMREAKLLSEGKV
jgi:mitochondrial fission process protein 1